MRFLVHFVLSKMAAEIASTQKILEIQHGSTRPCGQHPDFCAQPSANVACEGTHNYSNNWNKIFPKCLAFIKLV